MMRALVMERWRMNLSFLAVAADSYMKTCAFFIVAMRLCARDEAFHSTLEMKSYLIV